MSLHPIASAICAGLITLLCSLPLFSWAGEVAPPVAAPVVRTTTPPAADQPWGGAAKDLLPFIDPHAAYSAAIDWEYLLRNGATTKPTSLLADPRVAPVVALIREQLRLWANTKSEVPDLGSLLASADGCILGVVNRPTKAVNESSVLPIFVASISEDVTRDMKERIEKANILSRNKAKNVKIGAFSGMQWRPNVSLLFHGKKVFYGSEEALSEALTRPIPRLDPKLLAVPAWCTFDVTNYLREVAQADHDHSDPLNMAFWFGPNWRTSTPRFAATLAPGPAGWRSTVTISGISDLPLRRPSSAFAGCVPPRALASLMLGVDVSRAGPFTAALLTQILGQRTVESFSKLLADVGLSPDILRSALSGDFSCIVQPQAPLPAVTLVIGITPTVNADLLSPAMSAFGLTSLVPPANARAAWSGALPFGMIQVLLAQDRLVISSGDGEPFLKKFAQTIVNDEVTLDIDIPSLARLYLPLLYAQMPQRPVFFSGTPLWAWLFYLVHSQINLTDKNAHLPINMESDDGFRFPQEYWRKMVGDSTLTMNQCLALYDTVDQAGGQSRRKYVYRLADGWRLRGNSMADLINATILDKKSLDRQLEGLVLIAGTPYEALAPLPIGKQPCFDRQWLPAIAAVIEHLPLQHLSLRCVSGGITLYEDGTPCLGVIVSSLPAVLANIPAANSVASAIQVRDGEKMRVDHTVALNALHKALAHLQSRSPEDPPYLTPGEMLAGAGIDLADLSSLNGGKAPTATSINSLGFWHPHAWPHNNCEWLVPIGKGWFMEMAWWANTGAIITTLPRIEQRQWSEQEINAVMLKWKEVHLPSVKADEPAETPAPKPQAVNDF